jgi:hypothetical protein
MVFCILFTIRLGMFEDGIMSERMQVKKKGGKQGIGVEIYDACW